MRRICAAASVALLFLLRERAFALRGEEYDLASLILDSHAVVRAERGKHRHLANWAAATAYTVKHVYRGSMLPGQAFEVFGDENDGQTTGSVLETLHGKITIDRETILILMPFSPSGSGLGSWLPEGTPTLQVRSERFLAGGRVFERDDVVIIGGERPLVSVALHGTLDAFEAELRDAIARVDRFSEAARMPDPGARREAILALISPRSHALETGYAPLCHEGPADRIRLRAVELFAKAGDFDAALEVAARSGEGLGFHFQFPMGTGQLLAAARKEDAPPHRRAAALYLLARRSPTSKRDGLDGVPALLRSTDMGVKRAAAYVLAQALRVQAINPGLFKREDSLPIAEALLSAWREERDTAFRLTIIREAKDSLFLNLLTDEDRNPEVLLLWELREDRLAFTGEVLRGPPLHERSMVLVASDLAGNGVHRVPCDGWPGVSSGPGGEAVQRPPDLLRPGRYRIRLELETRGQEVGAKARVFRTESRDIDIPDRR